MSQKLMIIDTDCGIDDAQAIMLALSSSNVKILGITCCFGNTDVDNVCQNVLRVLSVCRRTQVCPVHVTTKFYLYDMFVSLQMNNYTFARSYHNMPRDVEVDV